MRSNLPFMEGLEEDRELADSGLRVPDAQMGEFTPAQNHGRKTQEDSKFTAKG